MAASNINDCADGDFRDRCDKQALTIMTSAETLTLAAYFFVLIILAVYGWHR